MTKTRIAILLVVTILFCPSTSAFPEDTWNKEPYWVHGRLSVWNGTPACRIWVVGTKRVLGIVGPDPLRDPEDSLPSPISKKLDEHYVSPYQPIMYADFLVRPLEPDTKGRMRIVQLLKAKRVVITREDRVVFQGEIE